MAGMLSGLNVYWTSSGEYRKSDLRFQMVHLSPVSLNISSLVSLLDSPPKEPG